MRYLHTMLRVRNLDAALAFWRDALGMTEVRRTESEKGRFTLVFLGAPGRCRAGCQFRAALGALAGADL